jgi:ABC-type antimicrobial peptide transport system permease subunit
VSVARQRIGAGYFSTLGIPLIRGGEFSERDIREKHSATVAKPAILNQTAARELFGAGDPIGRTVQEDKQSYNVIGVVRDTKSALLLANAVPTVYVPMEVATGATVIVRGAPNSDVMGIVRKELAALDSGLTIFNVRTMRESVAQMSGLIRLGSAFYFGIGMFGLILASIGLAGVTACAVARRRKEIGIRMALGARSGQVLQLVLKEGAVLVVIGSVLGFAAAFAASRALATTVDTLGRAFAMGTGDLRLLIGVPLLLVAIAMGACYIPARRSTRVAPLAALREE